MNPSITLTTSSRSFNPGTSFQLPLNLLLGKEPTDNGETLIHYRLSGYINAYSFIVRESMKEIDAKLAAAQGELVELPL